MTTITLKAPYEFMEGNIIESLAPKLVSTLPETITLSGNTYQRRSHLHCTIIAIKRLVPMLVEARKITPDAAGKLALEQAAVILENVNPQVEQFLPDLRVVSDAARDRQTLIIRVKVSKLAEFFDNLSRQLELSMPIQPSHVTLYAARDLPIGINSDRQIDEISRALTEDELAELKRQIDLNTVFGVKL